MLPEFPRAYDAIQKISNRILFDAAGFSDPLISQVAIRMQREGDRAFIGEAEMNYKRHSVPHQWDPEIGKGIPTDEFFGISAKIGREIASQQARMVFESMLDASPKAGTLSADEGAFTFDLWLEKMEGYELDFDESGLPKWPQWFASKEVIDEIQSKMGDGALTAEQLGRQAMLVARKRKEFNERESRRRLVD